MNNQFQKMSSDKKDETYAGFKMPGVGGVLSLGMAAVGAFKMVFSDNGSFKAKGMDFKWSDNKTSSSSSSSSNKPVEQNNYYYAY